MTSLARIPRTVLLASFAAFLGFESSHASAPLTLLMKSVSALLARALPALGLAHLIHTDLLSASNAPLLWLMLFVSHDIAGTLYAAWRLHHSAAATQAAAEPARQTAGAML